MSAATPGQADEVLIPDAFARWHLAIYGTDTPHLIAPSWAAASPVLREFWRSLDAAQQPQPAPEAAFAEWQFKHGPDPASDYDDGDLADAFTAGMAAREPQPAPGLAAAMGESRRYREALENVRAIILEGDNSTEGSRLRRSRAVIRAALEGR